MTRATILVIEDNDLNMMLTTDLLEIAGYAVVQAIDAETGIEMAREKRPDLILMDLALPRIDGLTAVRLLKEDPRTRDIPVVALTAHAMLGDERKALDAGCAGYIAKPIDANRFPAKIAEYLKRGTS
ncbi:MAG: response regulator [Deltaproteobacteria bacterium]|nr:response regulator [Deltaproteobacteria bacterium]